jgi:hypothetical protein
VEVHAPEVAILDRVTLPRVEARPWIDRLHREYRPSAESRGYTFAGIWLTHAEAVGTVEVVVLWTLPGPRDFFRSRATSHESSAWWQATDSIALRRERSVLQAITAP